jgi:hypothetical protein
MIRYGIVGSTLAGLLLLLAGCGGSGNPPTAKVTGTVTLKGAPVDGALVTFNPERGRPASGVTDVSGKFTLSTFIKDDGAVLGKHKVTIAESNRDKPPPMPGFGEPLPSRFPAKYGKAESSPLSENVEKGQKNDFTFDIK